MNTSRPRSLADSLRGRSEVELTELFLGRPDLAHPAPDTSGGLLGLGLLGGQNTTASPPPGLLQGVWGIFFPSADTTTAVPTTKCGGLIELGNAC